MGKYEILEGFRKLNTPTVSDALDKLKIRGGCQGLTPIVLGKKIVGPAFTVKFVPVGTVKSTAGDFIDDVKEGDVIVIDNGGRQYCTVWGDILTYVAVSKKIAGTVIDGVCRDVDGIRELNYPIFTRGHFMVTGKDRVIMHYKNDTVAICDIQVKPGDIVMGDQSGVLIIPLEKAEEVLNEAMIIEEAECKIIEEVKTGSTLIAAREKFRYNELQRTK